MIVSIFKRSVRASTPAPIEKERLKRRIVEFSNFLEPTLLRPMNMVEVVKSARMNGHTLVPSREFDGLPEAFLKKNQSGMIWTGTLVISEKEGKTFGESVGVVADWASPYNFTFDVPSGFRGKRGCLVLEYPEFEFEQLNEDTYRVSPLGWLAHVDGFPSVIGWFKMEQKFGLPIGEALKDGTDAPRYLDILNREFTAHISLVVRDFGASSRIRVAARPADKFKPLVRPIITPDNYVYIVINRVRQGVNDIETGFIREWIKEDPKLKSAIRSEIPGFRQ